jgi:exopolysaccharide biosynthesis polyprenyl glycosylphosphotransferase
MISQNLTILRRIQLVLDLALTAAAYHLTYLLRANIPFEPVYRVIPADIYARTLVLILLVWTLVLVLSPRAYQYRVRTPLSLAWESMRAVLVGTAFLMFCLLFSGHPAQSRITAGIFAVIDFALLFGSRLALLKTLEHYRRRGFNYLRVLVVGNGESARRIVDRAAEHPEWGIKLVGFVDWSRPKWLWSFRKIPLVGLFEHLPVILNNGHIDIVLFSDIPSPTEKFHWSLELCRKTGQPAYLLADFGGKDKRIPERSHTFLGWPVFPLLAPRTVTFGMAVKYGIDRLVALVGIAAAIPILATAAVWIKIDSPGPILFKQLRVGQNGRKFWMYKFRTMVTGAERLKKSLLTKNEMSGPVFKMTDDPRITKIGRLLRKTSLDELPQLFNVLLGDMSLVGPRPPLPEEVHRYQPEYRRRLSVRPGITCLWQISGRNNIDFENWMKLDLAYIDGWSFWNDLKILFRTIPAVLTANGAK